MTTRPARTQYDPHARDTPIPYAQGGMAWEKEGALLPGPGSYEHLDAFHPLYAGVCVCAGDVCVRVCVCA